MVGDSIYIQEYTIEDKISFEKPKGKIEKSGFNWIWNGGPLLGFVLCSDLIGTTFQQSAEFTWDVSLLP